MSNLKVFQYNNHKISFQSEGENGMINATQMSKIYCRKVSTFIRSKQFKDYVKVLIKKELAFQSAKLHPEKFQGASEKEIEKQIWCKKRHGKIYYTWFNYELAIRFAIWLNPEFAVWVSGKILDLMKNGSTTLHEEPAANHRSDTNQPEAKEEKETNSDWYNRMKKIIQQDQPRQKSKTRPGTFTHQSEIAKSVIEFFEHCDFQTISNAVEIGCRMAEADLVKEVFYDTAKRLPTLEDFKKFDQLIRKLHSQNIKMNKDKRFMELLEKGEEVRLLM